ncbi:TetR/AcrR family transcriptional regulator [Kitasatospora sp. NBC_01287]|uniref:TetR/AcrR family transcriptional regulator n=1 Tax=Kitasatospora sp. NBC_01287 TaxID=2903573 RepID=UPI00225A8556|nr:TetR/AcrR family transcriptional regulator [Kitasatospora sp. NBC_01287]MCX4744842.1 TetR/AcrR family transcriptional regulator [Kitasatospora sp. NBC_01287]
MSEQAVPSIWLRPERSGRGPAPAFDRDRLAAAGVALADAHGLAAVTMRAVAQSLGSGPASLYRYVSTREELLELMIDQVNGEISYAALGSGRWLDDMLALARQSRRRYLDHPWLLDALAQRALLGPHAVTYLERSLAALADLPATPRAKLEAIGVLGAVVAALARAEAAQRLAGQTVPQWQRAQAEYLAQAAGSGRHPHLAAALAGEGAGAGADADHGVGEGAGPGGEPAEQLFDRVVTRILVGLLQPGVIAS